MSRVRIGMVGLNFGRHIVDCLLKPPANESLELCVVCDRDPARVKEVTSKTGVRGTIELDQLLADPSLDAIGLFIGPVGRAEMIRRIIRAGKHVLTTKPFEVDPDAGLDVLLEAKRLGKVVHMNSPSPLLSEDLMQIVQWREKHNLGQPIGCRRGVWANYREQADGGWYDDPKLCPVAPIFRLGIYAINDLVRLFGDAEQVTVLQSRIFTGRPTPDNALLSILFKNGAIASVFASFCVNDRQFYSNSMTLNYENGTVYRNQGPAPQGATPAQSRLSVVALGNSAEPVVEHADFQDASGEYQWDAFARAVRGEKLAGEVTPQEIVTGLRIIAAMSRAQQSGAVERV